MRRKSTETNDFAEAQRRLVAFANRQFRVRDGNPDDVLLEVVLDEYIQVGLAGRASQRRCRDFSRMLKRFFQREGLRVVSDMTYDRQGEYMVWRQAWSAARGRTLSNATINRELDVLRAALTHFTRRGLLSSAPYIRKLPSPPPRDRYLSVDEVSRLLRECRDAHLRLFVLLAVHTLQRPSAILELQTRQVDFAVGRIDFLPPGAIQSAKRKPVVPISATLRPHLEQALTATETGYVIEYKGRPVKSIKRAFKAACLRAQLEAVTPYTLRHTGATLLAGAGVPMRQIAGMLGHSHLHTTERYAKHSPEYLKQAVEVMDRIFENDSIS
ncbi:MAG: site-specific integrase [Planctomycetota bacterium]